MKPVAAILVNYHVASDTIRCVQSIAEQTRIHDCIFIVDNAATAESRHSLEKLKTFHPGLKIFLLFNEKNHGFAAACNQAMKAIEDQGFNGYFWLVKNDTVADQNALKELLEEAEKTNASIQGPGLNFPEIVRAVPRRFIRSRVPLKDPVFSEIRLTNTLRERHS